MLEPIYPAGPEDDDEPEEVDMHSHARSRRVSGAEFRYMWMSIIEDAIREIESLFYQNMQDCFDKKNEYFGVESLGMFAGNVQTIYLRKNKHPWWLFFLKEKIVSRKLISVKFNLLDSYRIGNMVHLGVPDHGRQEPLYCELFMASPRLRAIVQYVLEPLAKQLGYARAEYIEKYNDPAAFYPGEQPGLVVARLLKS